ncbi:MAG: hypothetical protein IKG14_03620 [Clostridia bacterium]|nr:hypothetical protein [Clostridia bacterium]
MNKNKLKSKALIISSALIITASAIGGIAYAKYVTKVTGNGKIEVAKWSFLANGEDEDFGTFVLGRENYNAEKIANGKIAPGTSGTFNIDIDATGTETGVNYKVEFPEIHNKPTNLYFKVGDNVYKTFYELGKALSGSFDAGTQDKTVTKTVQWFWDYETTNNGKSIEENDAIDTQEGKNAYDFTFLVEVTGTQVRPA